MIFKWILPVWMYAFIFRVTEQRLIATRCARTSELLMYQLKFTFEEAQGYCVRMGGSLVKISNLTINHAIHDDVRHRMNWKYWIGATDKENEGRWKWTDGSNVEFRNWDDRQPDDHSRYRGEDCATILQNGKWSDEECEDRHGFVCQKGFDLHTYPLRFQHRAHFYNLYLLCEDWKTFYGASKSCTDKNSRLVEIATRDVQYYLKQHINSKYGETFQYWTGGSDLLKTNIWLWNNKTRISRTWGWKPGEPNGWTLEHCVISTTAGLAETNCNQKFAYVCEQVKVDKVILSTSHFVVGGSNKADIISCNATDAYPVANVSWYFSGVEVSFTKSLYQTKEKNRATLHTESMTVAEEGSYTCRAYNTIGNTTYRAEGRTYVKVPSHPNITYVTLESCTFLVTWTPTRRAIGIKHRITVSNGADKFTSMVTPTSENPTPYATPKLKSSTIYSIQITPCLSECRTEYSVSRNVVTGGLPGVARDVSVWKFGPISCKITWKHPKVASQSAITGHKISIMENLATSSENGILKTIYIGTNTTYLFHGKPNRRYSFGVQVVTCAGDGPSPRLTDTCTTEERAPFEVPKPIVTRGIDEEGKASLSVPVPDQKNGPLSCLFVIVRPEESAQRTPALSLKKLRIANASSPGMEYIAVAITATRLNVTTKDIILGDGESTSCNIYSLTGLRKRRSTNSAKDETFVGRNRKLNPRSTYVVYTVSTTPSGLLVFTKSSVMQTLLSTSETTRRISLYILIASIVGGLLLIAIIIGIVIFVKRRKQNADTRNQQQNNEHVYETPTIPMQLQEEPGYENVEQIHAQRKLGIPEDSAYETYDNQQPHPESERRIKVASPPGGEGEYEVPMRQYEEIK